MSSSTPTRSDVGLIEQKVPQGLLLAMIGMLILPGIDALAKSLADELTAVQISLGRFAFQSVLLTIFAVLFLPRGSLRMQQPLLLLAPGACMAIATVCIFAALKYLSIAEAIAIFFVEPLVLTIMAAVLLKERVGWRRISAIVVGFVGAILVIQPNFVAVGWPALLPLVTAVSFASYVILARRLAARFEPVAIQAYTGYSATALLALVALLGWSAEFEATEIAWPTLSQWVRLVGVGAVAAVGHVIVAMALRRTPASIMAPTQYIEIISATILGFIFFGDFPNALAWTGIAIIIGSGCFVYWREAVLSAPRRDMEERTRRRIRPR